MATPDQVRIRAMTSSQAIGEVKVMMTSSKNVLCLGWAGEMAPLPFVWLLIEEKSWKKEEKDTIRKVIKQFMSWRKGFANQMLLSFLLMALNSNSAVRNVKQNRERSITFHGASNVITNIVKNKYAADPSLLPPSKIQTTRLFQIRLPWKFAATSRPGRLWCEYKGVYSTLFWCNSKTQIIYREQHWEWQAT